MKKKKKPLSHEQAYIKAVCRAQREEVGFQPSITQRNRRKYRRADSRRELQKLIKEKSDSQ